MTQTRRDQLRSLVSLISLLVQRDLRVRYRGSFFGYLWSMLNPLLYMLILSFVFSHIVRFQIEHYSLYILSGILTWNLFAQSLGLGVHSIVSNGALLRKAKVHALMFPAASVCSVFVNFVLALLPYVVIAWFTGLHLTFWFLAIPLVLAPFIFFIFGLSLAASSLNVIFRDIGHTMEPLLILLFYASPVFYMASAIPEKYHFLALMNPMAHYLEAIRAVIFYGHFPTLQNLIAIYCLAFASLIFGFIVYRKLRDRFIFKL